MSFLISLFTGGFSGYYKIALYFALIFSGYYVEHLRFAHYVDQQAIVAQEQANKTKAIQKEQELINDGIKQTYEARIASIHAMYGRMHYSSSSSLSTSDASATITVNGQTINVVSLTEQCASTTAQLVSLQDWITENSKLNEH
jgi:hypothetical protein